MGRRGAERIVLIEGVAALRARPRDGTAVLRHDGGGRRDVAVLRRLAPYLASLRGRLVLHAAAAVFPAGAVLLCGEARAGKSTLALALDRSGIPVLGDDHVAVEVAARRGPRAYASFPFADADGPARRVVGRLAGSRRPGKESVSLETARPRGPVPIVAVAFVRRGRRVARTPLRPAAALAQLLREAVFFPDPADRRGPPRFLDACLRLLEAAPPVRLTVPSGLVRLSRTVEEVTDLWRRRDRRTRREPSQDGPA